MAETEGQVPEEVINSEQPITTEEEQVKTEDPEESIAETATETATETPAAEASTEEPVKEEPVKEETVKEETVEESDDDCEYECPAEFDEREEMCKMFVGGLDKDTSDDEFKGLFSTFGEVKDFIIIRKDNSKSDRLFGFITFSKCDDLEECLKGRPHNYKDKELDVKRAVPKSGGQEGGEQSGHYKVKKLHVANIPEVFDENILKKYLKSRHPKKYGVIEEINILKSKDEDGKLSDKNRGFGFITVSSEDFADRIAIAESKFKLDGNAMRINKAKPRNSDGNRRQYQHHGHGGGGWPDYYGNGYQYGGYAGGYGYGGGYGGYGYGDYNYGNYGGNYAPQGGNRGGRYKPY